MTALDLVDTSGGGLITTVADGPIVGDPNPALRIATNGFLTTGDLTQGDAGDVGGLPELTVEFWFRPGTFSGFTETMVRGPTTASGVQWSVDLTATNLISVTARNTVPTAFTATSTNALTSNAWHFITATVQAGFVNIYVNGVLAGPQVAYSGTFPVGYSAGSADLRVGGFTHIGSCDFSNLAVWRQGLTAGRVGIHYTAGALRGFPQQLSGSRIAAILDNSVSSKAPRSIAAGQRQAATTFMAGSSPKDMISDAVSVDNVDAGFFVSANGTLTYLDAAHRSSSPYNTVQVICGDAGGTEIAYLDTNVDYSESFLFNQWFVTRLGTELVAGVTQNVSDSTSITTYFKRSQSLSGVPWVNDSDSSTVATAMLAKYKNPMQRVTQIDFDTTDPAVAEALFRRELMDKITVKRTPPGGGARISQDLFIQKIDIAGSNDGRPWSVRWGVSPL